MNKLMTAEQALSLIQSGDTVAIGGFVGSMHPEVITSALEAQFLRAGTPNNLTIVYAAGQGDGKTLGMNHLGHKGLLRRAIGGHWGLSPAIGKLAVENHMEAYNLPQGVICHLYREIAAGRPGLVSPIGLHTFVDPRVSGGKMNDITTEELVQVVSLAGREYLFYPSFPIQIALVRASYCDPFGNATFEKEIGPLEIPAACQAVKNSGGKVILQVERVLPEEELNHKLVRLPGIYVDAIMEAGPGNQPQTYATPFEPAYCQDTRKPSAGMAPMPLDARKVIARRCAQELAPNAIINLGIGMPEGIPLVAAEQGLERLLLTVESGAIGGIPMGGVDFGAALNADCILDQPTQFDFYDGGGLDLAFLGMAQADEAGNINVSKFGKRIAGCGGFIDISQSARKVVFCGTFTAGSARLEIGGGELRILQDGSVKKFLKQVEQITFSGAHAARQRQPVLYVTERAVFSLEPEGMVLHEIAPGVDLERDVLGQMEFMPIVSGALKRMDGALFE